MPVTTLDNSHRTHHHHPVLFPQSCLTTISLRSLVKTITWQLEHCGLPYPWQRPTVESEQRPCYLLLVILGLGPNTKTSAPKTQKNKCAKNLNSLYVTV